MSKEVIVLLGPPGAGKGTQADLLAKQIGGLHLSSGQILRQNAEPAILHEMGQGELVREPEVDRILAVALQQASQDIPWILDGFIRLPQDAEWLEAALKPLGRGIDHLLLLDIPQEESASRTRSRGRADDTPEALEERWREYQAQTQPVVDEFTARGVLKRVDGTGSVVEVANRVNEALA